MTDVLAQPNPALRPWQPLVQQEVFRQLMRAFSYPGRVETLRDVGHDALVAVLASLLDAEVTLADPDQLVAPDMLTRLEARTCPADSVHFIVARGAVPPRFSPRLGTLESPEQGATVILVVEHLGAGGEWHLSGPGVDGITSLQVSGVDPAWLTARLRWNRNFPLGVDWILVDAQRIAAIPRTTRIALKGEH